MPPISTEPKGLSRSMGTAVVWNGITLGHVRHSASVHPTTGNQVVDLLATPLRIYAD